MRAKYIGAVLATLAAMPFVAARDLNLGFGGSSASSGISGAVSRIYEIIASFFNVPLSPTVLQGLMKFFFFLIIFSVSFWAMRRTIFKDGNGANDGLNRKTAGIIALAFALISVWFIPGNLFTDMTSIYPAIFVLLLILAPAIALTVGAFYLVSREGNQQPTISQHALGALMIGTAWGYTLFWHEQVPKYVAPGQFINIIDIVLAWVLIALPIAFIIKLIQTLLAGFSAAGGAGGAAGGGPGWRTPGEWWRDRGINRRERDAERQRRETELAERENALRDRVQQPHMLPPTLVNNVQFRESPGTPSQVEVQWRANDAAERVRQYHVWFNLNPSPGGRAGIAAGGPDPQNPGPIGAPGPRGYVYVGPTTSPNVTIVSGVPPKGTLMHVAVCAQNANGFGPCGYSAYSATTGTWTPVIPVDPLLTDLATAEPHLQAANRAIGNAISALRRLRVVQPAGMAYVGAAFPLVRPGPPAHPQWGDAVAAIDGYREAARELAQAATIISAVIRDPRFPGIPAAITEQRRLSGLLALYRSNNVFVRGGVALATGWLP